MATPTTLQKAIQFFSNYENCKDFMVALRWPDGKVKCPECGSDHVAYLAKAKVWKCYGQHSKAKFSLKTGTVFEDSPIGLDKWLPVMWMLVNSKNGVSSWEIHRAMGVTQKTAWFMLQRGRLAMQNIFGGKLGGQVEIDETFIGGKARNMHKEKRERVVTGTGGKDKVPVLGMVERDGNVRLFVVANRRKKLLQNQVRELDLPPFLTQPVKTQNPFKGELSHGVVKKDVQQGVQASRGAADGARGFARRSGAGVGSEPERAAPLAA